MSEASPDSKSLRLPPKAEIPKEHSSLGLAAVGGRPGDFCEGLILKIEDKTAKFDLSSFLSLFTLRFSLFF
jgi:hypothetical protein